MFFFSVFTPRSMGEIPPFSGRLFLLAVDPCRLMRERNITEKIQRKKTPKISVKVSPRHRAQSRSFVNLNDLTRGRVEVLLLSCYFVVIIFIFCFFCVFIYSCIFYISTYLFIHPFIYSFIHLFLHFCISLLIIFFLSFFLF